MCKILLDHWGYIAGGLSVYLAALITSMPESIPNSLQSWWSWLRLSLQSAIPVHIVRGDQKEVK